jgi:hypothetical protein
VKILFSNPYFAKSDSCPILFIRHSVIYNRSTAESTEAI